MIKSICFIGGGNMAEAMISGMVNSSYESQSICVVDRNELKRESLKSKYGIRVSVDLIEEVEKADILVLAIKPQQMSELILEIKDTVKDQLIVTVAAGIEVVVYENYFLNLFVFQEQYLIPLVVLVLELQVYILMKM